MLLVDDERGLLDLGKSFLERINENLVIKCVTSAIDALKVINTESYDVIVSDYQMPSFNGLEFLKKIRDEGNTIPFIIFTGKGREEVAIEALNLGANRYMQKGADLRTQYEVLYQAFNQEIKYWKSQEAIIERDQRFTRMTESIQDGLMIVENGKITFANKRVQEIYGYSREDFMNIKSPLELIAPEEKDRFKKFIEKTTKEDFQASEIAYWIERKDGERRYIVTRYSSSIEEKLKSHYVIMTDITERELANESLLRKIELEELVSSISTQFINADIDEIEANITQALQRIGKFIEVDRGYIYLIDEAKMVKSYSWFKEEVGPGADLFQNFPLEVIAWGLKKLQRFEMVYISSIDDLPPGTAIEADFLQSLGVKTLVAAPLNYKNTLLGYMGFSAVLEEKKLEEEDFMMLNFVAEIIVNALELIQAEKAIIESAEKYHMLFENARDAIVLIRMKGNELGEFIDVNDSACNELGYTKEEFLALSPTEIIGKEFLPQFAKLLENIISQGSYIEEVIIEAKDGTLIPTEISAYFAQIGGEKILFAIARNITDRVKTRREQESVCKSVNDEVQRSNFEVLKHLEEIKENLQSEQQQVLEKTIDAIRNSGEKIKNKLDTYKKHSIQK